MEGIKRDKFYSTLYEHGASYKEIVKAGYMKSKIPLTYMKNEDFYKLGNLCTPINKLKSIQTKQPIVLVTTGGFHPIHAGHLHMMNVAKQRLIALGYEVIGGYFAPDHDSYVSTKPHTLYPAATRIHDCEERVLTTPWMIDRWPALYLPTAVNFTDIIERLRAYLHKYVSPDIQMCYVFGEDNADFMACFKYQKDTFGICVGRGTSNFEQYNREYSKYPNCIFIENRSKTKDLCSRDIRKTLQGNLCPEAGDKLYLVRDEGLLPFPHLAQTERTVCIQQHFKNQLIGQLADTLSMKVAVASVKEQLEEAYKALLGKRTISLDRYFKGDYNLNLSREFPISGLQKTCNGIVTLSSQSLESQLASIPSGKYILVDDDSVSGQTLNLIKAKLPRDIRIEDIYLLANHDHDNIYDVVDIRDFILGAEGGGLVVKMGNDWYRAPYIMPYVNLTTRASIPASLCQAFSLNILYENLRFYKQLGKVPLATVDKDFQKLMYRVGFKSNTDMLEICEYHIRLLEKNLV